MANREQYERAWWEHPGLNAVVGLLVFLLAMAVARMACGGESPSGLAIDTPTRDIAIVY